MMKQTLMLLGAGALAFAAAPAAAKPDKGHGNHGKHGAHATMDHSKHGKAKAYRYGGSCPPGLSKHQDHCMPHGQFKKMYGVGQAYPSNYGNLWNYNQIPLDLRRQYGFRQDQRYYYGDGYLYQVDPRTMLIQRIVNAITR